MSTDRDTTRIVRSWLDQGVTQLPDRVLDAVLDQLPATPQRRATWWMPWRSDRMSNMMKVALASAAIVMAALLGLNVMGGQNVGGPAPDVTPAPSAAMLPLTIREIDPGRYALAGFPVAVEFDVPAGWMACSPSAVEQGVCKPEPTGDAVGLSFLVVENVVADPCDDALLDPPVGPSVDDLLTAVTNLDGFTADAPRDISVSGFPGKEVAVTAPEAAGCDLRTWSMGNRTNGVGPGERNLLRIVDVDGTRIVFAAATFPGETPSELVAEMLTTMDSIRIEEP